MAVLVSRRLPPEALGVAVAAAGCDERDVAVCARRAERDEQVARTDIAGLAAGSFDPRSVVVVRRP